MIDMGIKVLVEGTRLDQLLGGGGSSSNQLGVSRGPLIITGTKYLTYNRDFWLHIMVIVL